MSNKSNNKDKIEIPEPNIQYEPYTVVTDGKHIYEIIAPMYNYWSDNWNYWVYDHTEGNLETELIWIHIINSDFKAIHSRDIKIK
jgi:hypothetical protein